jgi:hypothetical protein
MAAKHPDVPFVRHILEPAGGCPPQRQAQRPTAAFPLRRLRAELAMVAAGTAAQMLGIAVPN